MNSQPPDLIVERAKRTHEFSITIKVIVQAAVSIEPRQGKVIAGTIITRSRYNDLSVTLEGNCVCNAVIRANRRRCFSIAVKAVVKSTVSIKPNKRKTGSCGYYFSIGLKGDAVEAITVTKNSAIPVKSIIGSAICIISADDTGGFRSTCKYYFAIGLHNYGVNFFTAFIQVLDICVHFTTVAKRLIEGTDLGTTDQIRK